MKQEERMDYYARQCYRKFVSLGERDLQNNMHFVLKTFMVAYLQKTSPL